MPADALFLSWATGINTSRLFREALAEQMAYRDIERDRLLRIWIIVFLANAVGAGIGAYVLANTGVLSVGAVEAASTFGTEDLETPWWDLFYKGVFVGFIVAGVLGGECFATR